MSSCPRDSDAGDVPVAASTTGGRRILRWSVVSWCATVFCLSVIGVAVTRTGPVPGRVAGQATQARDTVRRPDLRCLTRRAQDCLAEPVPADEPHGAVCAVCHDLWEHQALAQSARACSGGTCHTEPQTLAPFHRTVSQGTLTECTRCHLPHGFRVAGGGTSCAVCHQGAGARPGWARGTSTRRLPADLGFDHADHPEVACPSCHRQGEYHGDLVVTDLTDCRSCHHRPPVVSDCLDCHVVDEVRSVSFVVTRTLNIRIGSVDRPSRVLPFSHALHWETDCAACHTGGPALGTARGADCSACHIEHHEPTAACATCHDAPAPGAHDAGAHLGCGGPGCHDPVPEGVRWAPRTRPLCLVCHRDRVDHKPERNCEDCHALPDPIRTGAP